MALYYLQSVDDAFTADEIKSRVGLNPEKVGVVALNSTGVYPVIEADQPYDTDLYDPSVSYIINGSNADQTWSKTDKDLAVAKDAAKQAQKAKYEAEAAAIQDNYSSLVLIAISAKTAASRSANETAIIDSLKAIATNLSDDIIAIDAATDVDTIDAIVNP